MNHAEEKHYLKNREYHSHTIYHLYTKIPNTTQSESAHRTFEKEPLLAKQFFFGVKTFKNTQKNDTQHKIIKRALLISPVCYYFCNVFDLHEINSLYARRKVPAFPYSIES